MKRLAIAVIDLYQRAVSPMLPPACRFTPTCSEYARIAIETHGFGRGGLMAARRIARCHPFHPGGYDPVPGTEEFERFRNARLHGAAEHPDALPAADDAEPERSAPDDFKPDDSSDKER